MNIDQPVVNDKVSTIPDGYALLALKTAKKTGNVPSNLLHEDCIISYKVKKDLHDKIKTALNTPELCEKGNTGYV